METNMQDKNIGVFGYSANKPEFREFVKGFATGISKYNKCFYEPERQYRECDIAVIFGSFREDKTKNEQTIIGSRVRFSEKIVGLYISSQHY